MSDFRPKMIKKKNHNSLLKENRLVEKKLKEKEAKVLLN